MTRSAFAFNLPLLLSVGGAVGWFLAPGQPLIALPLLFCPGWGLLRLVSVVDRRFGVMGASLCLSVLALALVPRLVDRFGTPPVSLPMWIHVASILLCLIGSLRLGAHRRREARRPPHPAPMALWPARAWLCVALVALALGAMTWAQPPNRPAVGTGLLFAAAEAEGWISTPRIPVIADVPLSPNELLPQAAGSLALATSVHVLWTAWLVAAACLTATLLLAAECIARLWGNRGGARAMLVVLLGLNPLAGLFLLQAGSGLHPHGLTPGFDPELDTALSPFLSANHLAPGLAFTAMLMAATLSVLRRSSFHVPRLAGLAAFGLALSLPGAAMLLLPGWILGIAAAHLACRSSPDNDPDPSNPTRRADEPLVLRAPFWRLALPIAAGAAAGLALADIPELTFDPSRLRAWALLATVGPACVFFIPGVRHLNASPGREAYFFLPVTLVTAVLTIWARLPDDEGNQLCRLLALALSVPTANGALVLVSRYGRVGRALLGALVIALIPGPAAILTSVRWQPDHLELVDGVLGGTIGGNNEKLELNRAIQARAPADALVTGDFEETIFAAATDPEGLLDLYSSARIAVKRTTLPQSRLPDLRDTYHIAHLAAGLKAGHLLALRAEPSIGQRQIWGIDRSIDPPWPGFEPVPFSTANTQDLLMRNLAPKILLITIAGLRADRILPNRMPGVFALGQSGAIVGTAITPVPDTMTGLSALLTGRSPLEIVADPPSSLAAALMARGYRTRAIVALDETDPALAAVASDFQAVHADADWTADQIAASALDVLAAPDPAPLFLWVHLADLDLPFDAIPGTRFDQPFPADGDLDALSFGGSIKERRDELARGVQHYDHLIGQVDVAVDRMADSLFWQDYVVVTAPHGRNLVEHEAPFDHGHDLFDPSIRVPLVISGPEVPDAAEADRLWSLTDVAPLLLEGRRPDRALVRMRSLPRAGLDPDPASWLLPTAWGPPNRIWGERSLPEKTLWIPGPSPAAPAVGIRYELRRDPDELRPLNADTRVLERIEVWSRDPAGP